MKTKNTLNKSLLGFVIIGALSVPLAAVPALPLQPRADSIMVADGDEVVSGRVAAKSATALIVDGRSLLLTSETRFVKSGRMVTLDDVNAGDEVRVSTTPGADGSLLAVSVEVLASDE